MVFLAATELVIVFSGIILFIWRLQFTFPDFAWPLLGFLILSFFVHRDSLQNLGLGSHGFISGMKAVLAPTLIISVVLVLVGIAFGTFTHGISGWKDLSSFGRYFAWCLFQEFGLQSFFTNRILQVLKDPKKTARVSGTIFAAFHIPNPVLIPLTFFGGVILTRIFIKNRNLVPLALAQAIIGALTAAAVPVSWHHGLRVGPGYYQYVGAVVRPAGSPDNCQNVTSSPGSQFSNKTCAGAINCNLTSDILTSADFFERSMKS